MIMEVMVCIPTKEVVFVRMVCAEYSTTTLVVYSIYVMVGTFVMCCVMWDDCSSARRSNSETTGSLELIYRVYKKNRNILEYIYPAKQQNHSTRSLLLLLLLVPVLFIFVTVAIHIKEKEQTQSVR